MKYTLVGQNNGNTCKFQIYFDMLFWLQPYCELRLCAAPSYSFWINWVLDMVIKLYSNFRSCILVVLPNNPRKSLTVPISFRFFPEFCFGEEIFPSFWNAVITFERVLLATPNNSAVFVIQEPAIRAPIIWPLLKSDISTILMNFDYFFPISVKKKKQF